MVKLLLLQGRYVCVCLCLSVCVRVVCVRACVRACSCIRGLLDRPKHLKYFFLYLLAMVPSEPACLDLSSGSSNYHLNEAENSK
jgi:hypothetical protein